MAADRATGSRRGVLRRLGEGILKALGLFVLLEPIWMLLPFAGFLYGSVLRIETLGRSPVTAPLTHFVFPVLTLGWVGPGLAAGGLILFLAGAAQVYGAKLRRSGLVTGGLYRFVRHPQYAALALFGAGLLFVWGRAVMFLAFFLMMFIYYYLAKHEERACLDRFGRAYADYRARTSFVIPGDRLLRPLAARLPRAGLPAPVRVAGSLAATLGLCLALMWIITTVKESSRAVPFLSAAVPLAAGAEAGPSPAVAAGEAGGLSFVQAGRLAVVRGPYRSAWAAGFAEEVLLRLRRSETLKDFLAFLDEPQGDAAIVFCAPVERPESPGSAGDRAGYRGPAPDPAGPDRVRLIIMRCTLAPGADAADAFADKSNRRIRGACIAPVDLARPPEQDFVEGSPTRPGPGFPGEERWDFLVQQMAAQGAPRGERPAIVPGRAASATLVLVRAPILRTRLEPEFAADILDRLACSARFRDRLARCGAGGDVVAVAFPRPGPDWYSEHHRKPEVSVFVILARQRAGLPPETLFQSGGRQLLSAFIAEMDFKVDRPADAVRETVPVGPRRDLEERWRFFLSGVGGGF